MKSLITRFASIGSIFALVLASSSAWAVPTPISVRVHKVAVISSDGKVLVEVTGACMGTGTLPVIVMIDQSTAQSHAGTSATGSGMSTVKCDATSTPQTVALTVTPTTGKYNLGDATASDIQLGATASEIDKPIEIVFPVGEKHEEEEGLNPEE
jgi:hypothetical protein